VVDAASSFAREQNLRAEIGVVIGHRKALLEGWWRGHPLQSSRKLAWQREQNGTADALKSCFNDLPEFCNFEYTLVACADTPLITASELSLLFEQLRSHPGTVGVAATSEA